MAEWVAEGREMINLRPLYSSFSQHHKRIRRNDVGLFEAHTRTVEMPALGKMKLVNQSGGRTADGGTIPNHTHFHGFLEIWRIAACFFVIVSIGSAFERDFDGLGGMEKGAVHDPFPPSQLFGSLFLC